MDFPNDAQAQQLHIAQAQVRACQAQLRAMADVTFHVVLEAPPTSALSDTEAPPAVATVDVEAGSDAEADALAQRIRSHPSLRHALQRAYVSGEATSVTVHLPGYASEWSGTIAACPEGCPRAPGKPCLTGALRRERSASAEVELPYRDLLELLPDALFIVASNDRIQYANSAAVAMTGAAHREALVGTSIWTYVPAEAKPETLRRRKQVRAGGPVDFARHPLHTEDGTERVVESASVPMTYRGRRAALVAVRDLTGRERLSKTLERTLSLFDTAFHVGPAAAIIRLRDGLIMEVSERMEALTGFAAAELTGEHVAEVELGLPAHQRHQLVRKLLNSRGLDDRELTLTTAEGTAFTVLASARIIALDGDDCALVSLVDITERKRALVQAQETQMLMQKIFRMSPSPLAIVRLHDGVYLNANDALCTLIQRPRYDIVGRTDDEMALWADRGYRSAAYERLRETGTLSDVQTAFCRPDGTRIDVLCAMQRIQVDGNACAVIAITDITQREAARKALVDAKEKAEDVAQFRSSVLSNMTHEMRTPLTVILGFTPTLREAVDPKYRRFIDLIERSGKRLLFTLDSLLDLAQLEAGTLTPDLSVQRLDQLVQRRTGPMREKAKDKGLATHVHAPESPLHVRVDPDLLERVLHHVLDNAIKFTEHGSITIDVEADGDDALIRVSDTGAGIDPAFVPRAFQPFAQESNGLARTHQGSGLGLTVCKHVMERLNGSIDIATTKGEGSTITLRLPRAA